MTWRSSLTPSLSLSGDLASRAPLASLNRRTRCHNTCVLLLQTPISLLLQVPRAQRRVGPGLGTTRSFEVCFLITWSRDDTGGGAGGRSEHREGLKLRVPQTHSQHHPGASSPDSGQGLRPGDSPVASEIPWLLKYQVQRLSFRKLKFTYSARCWAHQQAELPVRPFLAQTGCHRTRASSLSNVP